MEGLLLQEVGPTEEGEQPLNGKKLTILHDELNNNWDVIDEKKLEKEFEFPDFVTALAFVNNVGEFAEDVNHHPNICFTWGKVEVSIYTHEIGGLRKDDFIWAAHVEKMYQEETAQ